MKKVEEIRRFLKYSDLGLKDADFQKIITLITDEQILVLDALRNEMYEQFEKEFVEKVKRMVKYF